MQEADRTDKLVLLLRDSARFLVIGAVFTAVWGVGGYFPVARFMTLTLLTTAAITVCFSGINTKERIAPALPLLVVMILGLLYGLLQLLPSSGLLSWTGVQSIQAEYGVAASSQSLVAWMTHDYLAMAVIGVAGYFLAACLFNDNSSRIMLLAAVAICGAAQVFWGIAQLSVYPGMIFWGVENPVDGSVPFGTFLNRNHASDFVCMSLACVVGLARWRFTSDTHRWHSGYGVGSHIRAIVSNPLTLAIWIGVIWLLLGVVITFSRGGWISAVVAAVLVALCWRRTGKSHRGATAIIACLTMVLAFGAVQFLGFGDKINSRVDDLEVNNLLTDSRFDHWAEAIPAAVHYLPFGSGLGTYGYAYLPFEPEPENGWFKHAHNQYLEIFMEAGIPGILLILAGLFFLVRAGLNLCGNDRSVSKQAMGIVALSVIVLQAFHAITDFGLMMPGNLLTFCVLLGAACAAAGEKRNGRKRKSESSTTRKQPRIARVDDTENSVKQSAPKTSLFADKGSLLINTLLLVLICFALWQQGRHVRASRLLDDTSFAASTPSPTVENSDERISKLRNELQRWPAYEPVARRLAQLEIHRFQRKTYDEIRATKLPEGQRSDPISAWDASSLESVVVNLYDDSENGPSDEAKKEISQLVKQEESLAAAWDDLTLCLSLNSVHPRTHLRMAKLGAASGRSDWRESFEKSMKLSVVDPKHSLGNGLLAWALGDVDSMAKQWQRSLGTDWASMDLIYKLSRLRLTEDEIAEKLMPQRWIVPFRLAQSLKGQESTDSIREKLLDRASEIANNTMPGDFALNRTLGKIAFARGDRSSASEYYGKAIETDPRNAEVRYLASVALSHVGSTKQAVKHARVATMLAPKNNQYRNFYDQVVKLHRRQYSQRTDSKE